MKNFKNAQELEQAVKSSGSLEAFKAAGYSSDASAVRTGLSYAYNSERKKAFLEGAREAALEGRFEGLGASLASYMSAREAYYTNGERVSSTEDTLPREMGQLIPVLEQAFEKGVSPEKAMDGLTAQMPKDKKYLLRALMKEAFKEKKSTFVETLLAAPQDKKPADYFSQNVLSALVRDVFYDYGDEREGNLRLLHKNGADFQDASQYALNSSEKKELSTLGRLFTQEEKVKELQEQVRELTGKNEKAAIDLGVCKALQARTRAYSAH